MVPPSIDDRERNQPEPDYDVCIIGAGIAGCMLAAQLDPGFRVMLVEARRLPRAKPCSGVLAREGIEALLPLSPPRDLFVDPHEIDIAYWDWSRAGRHRASKRFWNLDRGALDAWLLERLRSSRHVTVAGSTRLTALSEDRHEGIWKLDLRRGGRTHRVTSRFVVGCDGANSLVRREITSVGPRRYLAIQELVPCGRKARVRLSEAHFIFADHLTDWYGWVIPKGDFVDVGIAADARRGRQAFELFRKEVSSRFSVSGSGTRRAALLSRPGTLDEICLGSGRLFLAGEAAGLISPSSGEGISFALRSGDFLAATLNEKTDDLQAGYRAACRPLLERLSVKIDKSHAIQTGGDPIALFGAGASRGPANP
jgi:flavin-dependent dehydrogenase